MSVPQAQVISGLRSHFTSKESRKCYFALKKGYFLSKILGSAFRKIKSRHLGLSDIKITPLGRGLTEERKSYYSSWDLSFHVIDGKERGGLHWNGGVMLLEVVCAAEKQAASDGNWRDVGWSSRHEAYSSGRILLVSSAHELLEGTAGQLLLCDGFPAWIPALGVPALCWLIPKTSGALCTQDCAQVPPPSRAVPRLPIFMSAFLWWPNPEKEQDCGDGLTLYRFPFFWPGYNDKDCIRSWAAHKFREL